MTPSFEEVFRAEFPALHRYLHRRVGASAADDLTAATFAAAYAKWDRFERNRRPRPWLYGIAANLVRRYWRDEQRNLRAYARTGVDPIIAADDDACVGRLHAEAQRRQLAAALGDLRAQDREILLLHAWAELSDVEIASALSLPVGTVKSRLHRTREQLRSRIAGCGQAVNELVGAPREEAR